MCCTTAGGSCERTEKNQRVRAILEKKLLEKEKKVSELKTELDLLRAKHPNVHVVKRDFDDDPEKLREKMLILQKDLINLQTKQIQVKKNLKQIKMDLVKEEANEKFARQEIDQLADSNGELSTSDQDQSETIQLAVIKSEYQSIHDLLDTLTLEIEQLHKKLHQRR